MKLSPQRWGAVGLLLRLGWAVKMGLNEPPLLGSDQYEFDTYAWNLAQGNGYRGPSPDVSDQDHLTAYRVTGTAIAWAAFYRLFGHRYDVVRVFHCVIGALTILLIYGIGRRCFDERVGLLASTVFTAYSIALFYSVDLVSEPLAAPWMLWFVYASLRFAKKPTLTKAVWTGLLLGCSLLTRASSAFMMALAGIWALWQFRERMRESGLALCIPLSTQRVSALLQGNNDFVVTNPVYYGFCIWDTAINDDIARQLKSPNNEVERDRVAQQLAVQWLKDNPGKWWYLVQAKFRRSWTPFLQQPLRAKRLLYFVTWGPILVLFGGAFFPTLARFLTAGRPGWLIHLAIAHYALNSVVFYALARYHYPIEGLCIILACATSVWVWDRVFPKRRTA